MSGGHFDYKQHEIMDVIAQLQCELVAVDHAIASFEPQRDPNVWTHLYCNYTKGELVIIKSDMIKLLDVLSESYARLHCLDYLIACDYSFDSYQRVLEKYLKEPL